MIDSLSRQKVYDMQNQKRLVQVISDAMKGKSNGTSINTARIEFLLDRILQLNSLIYKKAPEKAVKFPSFPKSIDVDNLDELGTYFKMLNDRINALATAISKIPPSTVQVPKIEFPKMKEAKVDPKMIDLLQEIADGLKKIKTPKVEFPSSVEVSNWPVQMTPQPVTNININPLRGIVHTTAVTVTTSLTPLPSYGVLDNRRSMIIFNNDSTNAIYIGGSDVTTSNGLPVLAQSYSPAVDSGPLQKWYGVATTSVNVRVCEVQNDSGA